MTYKEFKAAVKTRGFTLEQLRCDVRPDFSVLKFIDECGSKYEYFVLKFQTEPWPVQNGFRHFEALDVSEQNEVRQQYTGWGSIDLCSHTWSKVGDMWRCHYSA